MTLQPMFTVRTGRIRAHVFVSNSKFGSTRFSLINISSRAGQPPGRGGTLFFFIFLSRTVTRLRVVVKVVIAADRCTVLLSSFSAAARSRINPSFPYCVLDEWRDRPSHARPVCSSRGLRAHFAFMDDYRRRSASSSSLRAFCTEIVACLHVRENSRTFRDDTVTLPRRSQKMSINFGPLSLTQRPYFFDLSHFYIILHGAIFPSNDHFVFWLSHSRHYIPGSSRGSANVLEL